jgi:hypothetical protein
MTVRRVPWWHQTVVPQIKKEVAFMADQFDLYNDLLTRARQIVESHMPDTSLERKAAFANTAAGVVTGVSGGFGGPSVREHIATAALTGRGLSFEEVLELLLNEDGFIFGPLGEEHFIFWARRHAICFDDDPRDVALLNHDPERN